LQEVCGLAALFALAVCAPALALGKGGLIPTLVVGVLWAMSLGRLAGLVAEFVFDPASSAVSEVLTLSLTAFPAILFALACLGPIAGSMSAATGLVVLLLFHASSLSQLAPNETVEVYPQIEPEDLFAAQAGLLDRQLDSVQAGNPERPELFAILGAGDPHQQVFAREVEAVSNILVSDFDAEGRIVRLVNSAREPLLAPLLSRQNLTKAIASVRGRMQDDDILLLFLASHGRPEHLDTEFSPFIPYSLSANDIASALAGANNGSTVAILSACYSGSFSSSLAASNRLILTAADADSLSFGCNDKSEWTEWGRAFWVDALSQNRDFRDAARIAKVIVARREAAQELPPSDPMIVEGAAIGTVLDRWLGT
ncbi:MAG: C13 family peptidase, partial [Boseongicola sp.]